MKRKFTLGIKQTLKDEWGKKCIVKFNTSTKIKLVKRTCEWWIIFNRAIHFQRTKWSSISLLYQYFNNKYLHQIHVFISTCSDVCVQYRLGMWRFQECNNSRPKFLIYGIIAWTSMIQVSLLSCVYGEKTWHRHVAPDHCLLPLL